MKLILITGHSKEGKSYLADKLCSNMHIPYFALADELKMITNELFALFNIPTSDDKEVMRPYYQTIGTEICRKHFGNEIWCETLERKINACDSDVVIINDIRYINEYNYFKSRYKCFTIRCHSQELDGTHNTTHSSEQQIESIPVDYTFENVDDETTFEHNLILLGIAISVYCSTRN